MICYDPFCLGVNTHIAIARQHMAMLEIESNIGLSLQHPSGRRQLWRYQRLASRRAGTRAFGQTFIAQPGSPTRASFACWGGVAMNLS